MDATNILITILVSLSSGLLGVLISPILLHRLERRRQKQDLTCKLLGSRYDINGKEFSSALNAVMGVFSDDKIVLKKLVELYKQLKVPGKPNSESALIDLLKAVSFRVVGT